MRRLSLCQASCNEQRQGCSYDFQRSASTNTFADVTKSEPSLSTPAGVNVENTRGLLRDTVIETGHFNLHSTLYLVIPTTLLGHRTKYTGRLVLLTTPTCSDLVWFVNGTASACYSTSPRAISPAVAQPMILHQSMSGLLNTPQAKCLHLVSIKTTLISNFHLVDHLTCSGPGFSGGAQVSAEAGDETKVEDVGLGVEKEPAQIDSTLSCSLPRRVTSIRYSDVGSSSSSLSELFVWICSWST